MALYVAEIGIRRAKQGLQLTMKVLHLCSPGNKTKALPFDVYKGFVLGEKISTLSPHYEENCF
jgi:hypothetical protein